MANAWTKHLLSESTDGRPIKLSQTFGPGVLIHTAGSGQTNFDELYIYGANTSGSGIIVTLEWGGVLDPDDYLETHIPPNSIALLAPEGLPLQNSLKIRGFATQANLVNVIGWVNRLTVT